MPLARSALMLAAELVVRAAAEVEEIAERHAAALRELGVEAGDDQAAITDVAHSTVDSTMARFGIPRLIHGHTHRPKVHDEAHGTRIVLGDWYEQGSVLRVDRDGADLSALT